MSWRTEHRKCPEQLGTINEKCGGQNLEYFQGQIHNKVQVLLRTKHTNFTSVISLALQLKSVEVSNWNILNVMSNKKNIQKILRYII